MKTMLVVIDGMEDMEYPELGNKTPMSFAVHLNRFQKLKSESHTPYGMEPDTLTCMLHLLGVPPERIPKGRAFMEAVANHIEIGESDLVLRLNTVGVENGVLIASGIERTLSSNIDFPVYPINQYRRLMVIPNGKKYAETLITHAPHQNIGRPIADLLSSGNPLGDELNKMTLEMLEEYQNAAYIAWNPSAYTSLPFFQELHHASGAVISKTDVVIGIAKLMQMDCPAIYGATGDIDTSLFGKLEAALTCSKKNDFVLLHINGADEASHRKNPVEKAEFIKKIDIEILSPLLQYLPSDFELIVTSDHAAICKTGAHSSIEVSKYYYRKEV